MENYLQLGLRLINEGQHVTTRTGKTRSLTGQMLEFNMNDGFPMLTTKYINFKHILHEVIWYLKGTDSIKYLKENGIHIWDAWADENDSIGKTYGYQWRSFNGNRLDGGDQVATVIQQLQTNPGSRRIMINGWNPLQLHEMRLPPCIINLHFIAQEGELDLIVYQRSADFCLGVPYDIAEMALLLHHIAELTDHKPRKLTIMYGDIHIYENHITTFIEKQLPIKPSKLPTLVIATGLTPLNETKLIDYFPGPKIKYEIAI